MFEVTIMPKPEASLRELAEFDAHLFWEGLQARSIRPCYITKLRQEGGEQSAMMAMVAEVIARVQPGRPAEYDEANPGELGLRFRRREIRRGSHGSDQRFKESRSEPVVY
jgi:hypothetical protein